jgi:UPF0176 protein
MTSFNAEMNAMLDRLGTTNDGFVVAALYKFVSLDDIDGLRQILQQLCDNNQILGTILLAEEGINGTIAAPRDGMTRFLNWLEADGRFDELSLKFSFSPDQPFLRMKVRPKREIVTMGCPEVNPAKRTGTYVDPKDWNGLIADPDVLLVDTRNSYETAIGMFAGAVDPMTTNFREFPDWAHSLANQPADRRPKKVAMYCTGGIRCEKASALMQDMGFDEVYHLKGGILKYLEDVPAANSQWQGECFVFDGRVAVDHDLQPGSYDMCHACRMPLSADDLAHPDFENGISCPHCKPELDPDRAARFAERQKQMRLAAERGEAHLGIDPRRKKTSPSTPQSD